MEPVEELTLPRIEAVELRRIELRLVTPIETAKESHLERPFVLVRILGAFGEGWGECDALAGETYVGEGCDAAEQFLYDALGPLLLARKPSSVHDAISSLGAFHGHEMAKAAIEMAMLDAALRASSCSLRDALGGKQLVVSAGATIGIDQPETMMRRVAKAVEDGYRRVKLKIAPQRDLVILRAVRESFPHLEIVADANGSYDGEETEDRDALHSLDVLGLVAIEQPLARADLSGSSRLSKELSTPVILDESVTSKRDLEAVIGKEAADGIVLKPAKSGGVLAARSLYLRAQGAGLGLSLGGMFEAGLGRAASLCLGSLGDFVFGSDLGASDRYFERDLTTPHVLFDGNLAVPDGPGLGLDVDHEILEATTRRVRVL